VTRIDVVRSVVAAIGAQRYLEIGVRDGECFDAIAVPTRIAVDPQFRFRPPLRARLRTRLRRTTGTLYFALTSDAFFSAHGKRLAPLDVAFVDGLHTYEQAHRDVVHCLELLSDEGVVIVHDCSPRSEAAAAPTLATAARSEGFVGEWNGDVYKAIVRLRTRDDLRVDVLDCDQGIGIVRRGAPGLRLDLSVRDVARLRYEDLDRDRERLLGLRPAVDLPDVLPAGRA
jgi:hypothetical protein